MKRICYENNMLYLRVYLCFNQEQFDAVAKHYRVREPMEWCRTGVGQTKSMICPDGSRVHIISINKKDRTRKDLLNTLVHECHMFGNGINNSSVKMQIAGK